MVPRRLGFSTPAGFCDFLCIKGEPPTWSDSPCAGIAKALSAIAPKADR